MTQLPRKRKPYYLITIAFILLLVLLWVAIMKVIDFSNTHYIQKNPIVQAKFAWPLEIKKKEEAKVVEKFIEPAKPEQVDTPTKKFIYDTFNQAGEGQGLIAVAVAEAEGLNHPDDDYNTNTNGTIDVGVMRVNSVHFGQPGCSLQEVVYANKNILCAYSIWKASGWKAWSSVNNGSYLAHL